MAGFLFRSRWVGGVNSAALELLSLALLRESPGFGGPQRPSRQLYSKQAFSVTLIYRLSLLCLILLLRIPLPESNTDDLDNERFIAVLTRHAF